MDLAAMAESGRAPPPLPATRLPPQAPRHPPRVLPQGRRARTAPRAAGGSGNLSLADTEVRLALLLSRLVETGACQHFVRVHQLLRTSTVPPPLDPAAGPCGLEFEPLLVSGLG
jgi:hypothetical protein